MTTAEKKEEKRDLNLDGVVFFGSVFNLIYTEQ